MNTVQIISQSVMASTLSGSHGNEWHFERLIYIAIAIGAGWLIVKALKMIK